MTEIEVSNIYIYTYFMERNLKCQIHNKIITTITITQSNLCNLYNKDIKYNVYFY